MQSRLLATLLLSVCPWAQNGNELALSRPGEKVIVFGDPSRGGPPGSPDVRGDLWWKSLPAPCLVTASGTASLERLAGLFVGTTDWSTPPPVADLGIGRARPLQDGSPSLLVPEVLASGIGSLDVLVSIGSSGLPNPCTLPLPVAGCVQDAGSGTLCAPPISGYDVTIEFTQPILIPADGVHASAVTAFLPAGRRLSSSGGGNCDQSFVDPGTGAWATLGDYVFCGAYSAGEHQADAAPPGSGDSLTSGVQLGSSTGAPSGPIALRRAEAAAVRFGFHEPLVQALVRDPGAALPYDVETASSGVLLDVTSARAELGVEVRSLAHAGATVFPCASEALLTPPGPPGLRGPRSDASLLLAPTALLNDTLIAWSGTGVLNGVDLDGDGTIDEALARTSMLAVPPSAAGLTVHLQAFLLTATGPLEFESTSVFTVRLY